jgi:2-O-A-mannosyl-D-glycerate-specific PTS system IIC component
MNLTSLTTPALINLKTTFESRDEAINALAQQLHEQGKLHDKEEYLKAVFAREEQGPTALGEGLAVPHGKTDAVKEAAFAMATLKKDIQWQGIDEDEMEEVNLIFLIAIPNAEAGSTHMQLLTELTSTLVDDEVREAVLNATTIEQILTLLGEQEEPTKIDAEEIPTVEPIKQAEVEQVPPSSTFANKPTIIVAGIVLAIVVLIANTL